VTKNGVRVALAAGFLVLVSVPILFVCFFSCVVHILFIIKSLEFKSLYKYQRSCGFIGSLSHGTKSVDLLVG
jgi:hypothetical protein